MIGLVVAMAVLGAAPADPIGPAKRGMVQCYDPDTARKTCRSFGGYAVQSDGTIINTAIVLVAPKPVIVMQTAAPVVIRDGAICGKVTSSDIEHARFTLDGKALSDEQAAKLKTAVAAAEAPMLGREICTKYPAEGERLSAQAWVDGVRNSSMDQPVIWVDPSDFKVAP